MGTVFATCGHEITNQLSHNVWSLEYSGGESGLIYFVVCHGCFDHWRRYQYSSSGSRFQHYYISEKWAKKALDRLQKRG